MLDIRTDRLSRPYQLVSPWPGDEFAVLLVIRDTGITEEERSAVSQQLVAQGCRYAVCMGPDSGRWDDAIDCASVEAELDGAPDRLIMTTWHEQETLDEVLDFFLAHTTFEGFSPQHYLALQMGGSRMELAELERALHQATSGRTKR